jgi:hypothetical protein
MLRLVQLASLFLAVHVFFGTLLVLGVGISFGWSQVHWALPAFGPFPVEFLPWMALAQKLLGRPSR